MELINAPIDQNFDIHRAVSENQQWQIGLRSMIFGVRVCGNRVGSNVFVFDYCAGADRYFVVTLLAIMKDILSSLPESISERELERILPKEGIKPNTINSECTQELIKLAVKLKEGRLQPS